MRNWAYLISHIFIQSGLVTCFFYALSLVQSLLGFGIILAPFILSILAGVKIALFFFLRMVLGMKGGLARDILMLLLASSSVAIIMALRFPGSVGDYWLLLFVVLGIADLMAHMFLRLARQKPGDETT